MKRKHILLSLLLVVVSILPIFGLFGCGTVSIDTLKESYKKLDEKVAQYSVADKDDEDVMVFVPNSTVGGLNTDFKISYGGWINARVLNHEEGFSELESKFNMMLIIATDHLKINRTYLENLVDKDLTNLQRHSLTNFNTSLVEFTNYIDKFVDVRNSTKDYFKRHGDTATADEREAGVRKLKSSYAVLVSKSVEASKNLAEAVEKINLLEILERGSALTNNDLEIIKEYLRAKLLPIFSDFMVDALENNINWNGTEGTETKSRIDALTSDMKSLFESYQSLFVKTQKGDLKNNNESQFVVFEDVKSVYDAFLTDENSFLRAIENLDIRTLGVDYKNDMNNYKEKNPLAEVSLEKMENFVEKTLPKFMNYMKDVLIGDQNG